MEYIEFLMEKVEDIYVNEASSSNSRLIVDKIYPLVESVLSTPEGDRKFKRIIGTFIDKNSAKLHTAGPQYLIPFTERDKEEYFNLFKVTPNEIRAILKDVVKIVNDKANWVLITNNPIYTLFFCVNRFYAIKKDDKSMNLALATLALSMYPSMFHKYFPYEPNPAVMQFTIDNLSNKFIIKKTSHVFGLLMATIQQCFIFHNKFIIEGSDITCINYIMRIRNAFNSSMKKIANEFNINYKKNNTIHTVTDTFDDNAVVDIENNTNKVESVTQKIVMTLLTSGLDLRLAEAAAKSSQVSISDIRNYLNIIITEKGTQDVQGFIESILFLFMYDTKKSLNDINSKAFLEFCLALYKKTNSNNANIGNIKKILDKWGEIVGLNKSFSRAATLINYKRAIYMFFVLAIQKYN